MGPREITKRALATPTGGTVIITKRDDQTRDAFVSSIQNYRARWKDKYGLLTSSAVVGSTATISIIRGLDMSTAAVADMLERPRVSTSNAPAPAAPVVLKGDDARQMWRDSFLVSLQSSPGAPAETHVRNARAAAEAMVSLWGDT